MQNLINTMKSANLKGKIIAIALILVLTMSSALAILPTTKATLGSPWPYTSTPTKGTNGLWNVPTFAGITASPDPIGVGQPVQVIMVIELLPPSTGSEGASLVTGGWIGYVLTITDPNGTATTMGPYESDVSGTYQVTYTPTMVGTYTFQYSFPGQTVNGTGYGNYYANFLPSTSDKVSLTVQQAPIAGFSEAPVPLPTQYWTQPIDAQNRYWNSISGPWLQSAVFMGANGYNNTGAFNPYTYAPQSAHILWTKTGIPLQNGLVGGQYGSLPFGGTGGVTGAIESNFNNPIVMGGYVYYSSAPEVGNTQISGENPGVTDQAVSTESCMNLQTGQVVWTVPLSTITGAATPASINYGQILDWRDQQQRLCMGYLWSVPAGFFGMAGAGNYQMYDASTGALLAQWGTVPAGTTVAAGSASSFYTYTPPPHIVTTSTVTPIGGTVVMQQPQTTVVGQDIGGAAGGGAMLVYFMGTNPGASTAWLACWNSTLAIEAYNGNDQVWNFQSTGDFPSITSQLTTPLDWNFGIMWNITIPNPPLFMSSYGPASWSILGADGNYVIMTTGVSNYQENGQESFIMAGVNVANQPETTSYTVDVGGDVQHPTTGALAWETNITEPTLDQTFMGGSLQSGGLITFNDGTTLAITAYSESTGALLWSCNPWNNDFAMQSVGSTGPVAYGMIYNAGYDGYMHAINATTGVQVWDTISRPGGLEMPEPGYPLQGDAVAGNEVFTSTNKAYETQPAYRGHCLYAYDAMTGAQNWNISGEFLGFTIADGILLSQNSYDGKEYAFAAGPTATTVSAPQTEITAGSNVVISGTVTDQTSGIAQGTPAISDTWMTPWMEYLYMNQPLPHDATGVPVSIDAIDPNGNFIHIGNATSDITGNYHYTWATPDIPGQYTIVATFSADNSYYGSSSETAAVVGSAATTTVSPTPTPTSVADMYFVPAIAGLFVLIVIVAIVLALLMLRKRP
jgi:hypothetical protein